MDLTRCSSTSVSFNDNARHFHILITSIVSAEDLELHSESEGEDDDPLHLEDEEQEDEEGDEGDQDDDEPFVLKSFANFPRKLDKGLPLSHSSAKGSEQESSPDSSETGKWSANSV